MVWILLVLLYGLLKGSREISKKKAMDKNSVMEVLFTYTLISFILVRLCENLSVNSKFSRTVVK